MVAKDLQRLLVPRVVSIFNGYILSIYLKKNIENIQNNKRLGEWMWVEEHVTIVPKNSPSIFFAFHLIYNLRSIYTRSCLIHVHHSFIINTC